MMNRIEKEIKIADAVARKLLFGEELSEEEEIVLQEWLKERGGHQEWLRKYQERRLYREFEEIIRLSDTGKQWRRLEWRVKGEKRIRWRKWGAYAAGVALLVCAGLWLGLHREETKVPVAKMSVIMPGRAQALLILNDGQRIALKNRDTVVNTALSSINVQTGIVKYNMKETENVAVEYNTIEVPRGGIYSLELSDGTKVFLNSDSRLKYPVRFDGEYRKVELSGEAFFEVSQDSLHPFIVDTKNLETRVLGTSFDVLAYPDEPTTKTTLLSGRVQVRVHDSSLEEVLVPGMQASWSTGAKEITIKKVNVEMQSLWRDRIIMLDDNDLESVMRMLSRWYDVTYEFRGDRSVKHTFTGKIDLNEDLGSVLTTLTLLGGPRFEIETNVVYIY